MSAFTHAGCEVLENAQLAERTWRLRLRCSSVAGAILPGQFLMLRLPGRSDLARDGVTIVQKRQLKQRETEGAGGCQQ